MALFSRKRKGTPQGAAPATTLGQPTTVLIEVASRFASEANTSRAEDLINNVLSEPDMVRQSQGGFGFAFPDYEDAEFIYLVPEVRRWVRTLHQRVKHLFYFLDLDPDLFQHLEFLTAFDSDDQILRIGDRVAVVVTPQARRALLERLFATGTFASEVGVDVKTAVGRIAEVFLDPEDAARVVAEVVAFVKHG